MLYANLLQLTDATDVADSTSEWAKVILSLSGGVTGVAIIVFLVRRLWVALTLGLEADYARMKKERDELIIKLDAKEGDCDLALTQRDEWHQKYDNLYWEHRRLELSLQLRGKTPKELKTNDPTE